MKLFVLLFFFVFASCANDKKELKDNFEPKQKENKEVNKPLNTKPIIPIFPIKVLRTIPHDTLAFTQGLLFYNGYIYESTGQYGHSSLRKINPFNGKIEQIVEIEKVYFAEGIALHNGKLYMLTWRDGFCFIFNIKTFQKEDEIHFLGEGWGLTNYDQNLLVQSDGTNILKILDPSNFNVVNTLVVFADTYPISNLNELENVEGDIWANIWMKDSIAVIDKNTGKVKFFVDVSPLRNYLPKNAYVDVINGIAYNQKTKKIYLTGKFWPFLFEVELIK